MAAGVVQAPGKSRLGATDRRDRWWVGPLVTALGLGAFIIYATFRAAYNADFRVDRPDSAFILSPFYSPLIVLPWLPAWVSPAFVILWAPGGFRLTCYYYRKAYYRAFFLDPAACAVGEGRHGYHGETRVLLFQNLHRYFLYLAIVFLAILAIDVVHTCRWPALGGGHRFGMSVATLVLAANVTLLGFYTASCHSLRHLVGGNVDCFSCAALGQARYRAWRWVSRLNSRHMLFAWTSLFSVGFADFYVWMIASGNWSDVRIF